MRWTDRRERFRALFAGNRCVHPGSVFDPLSARIAEELGFETGMFAGSVASLTVLGAPDLILLTLSEFAEQAYRINRAAGLPLMVDARSEEHTSELQSLMRISYAVFCLKKKNTTHN